MQTRKGKNTFIKCHIPLNVNSPSGNVKAFKTLVKITIAGKDALLGPKNKLICYMGAN
jgi:hypothetical protein